MTKTLKVFACTALLTVAGFFGSVTYMVWVGWHSRGEVGKAITVRVDPILRSITTASDAVTKTANGLPKQVDTFTSKADDQLTAMRGTVDATVAKADAQMTSAQATLRELGSPVAQSYVKLGDKSTELVADAKDSWDDLFNDVRSLVQSGEVLTTGAAISAETIAKAMPHIVKDADQIADSATSVAKAASQEAVELTKPQTTRQKIMAWLGMIPRIIKLIL